MSDYAAEFHRCIEECDVAGIRRLWLHVAPRCPQPKSDAEALRTLHMSRTRLETMPLNLRAYSHRWLLDQGLPSQLPDELKPVAERLYPKVVEAVGISVNFKSEALAPLVQPVQSVMEVVANEAHADPKLWADQPRVRRLMMDAKARELKKLVG